MLPGCVGKQENRSRGAGAQAARNHGITDAVVGETWQARDLGQPSVDGAQDHEVLHKVGAIDIGDLDPTVPVQIANTGRGEPAVALADKAGRGAQSIGAIDSEARPEGKVSLDHDDLGAAVTVDVGEPRLDILEHPGVRQCQAQRAAAVRLQNKCSPFNRITQNGMVVPVRGIGQPCCNDAFGTGRSGEC